MKSVVLVLATLALAAGAPNDVWEQRPTNGVSFEIVGKKPVVLSLQSSSLRLRVTNSTSKPICIWSAGYWPNHTWKVTELDGRMVQPSAAGKKRLAAFGSLERDKNVKIVIDPGKKLEYTTPNLFQDFDLKAGAKYRIVIAYSDACGRKNIVIRTSLAVLYVSSTR